MLFLRPLAESITFVTELNAECMALYGTKKMSSRAIQWVAFCLTGIAITGSLCWNRLARSSAGSWTAAALSEMFRHCPSIPWKRILLASTSLILKRYQIRKGHLAVDDFDNHRAKKTPKIELSNNLRV